MIGIKNPYSVTYSDMTRKNISTDNNDRGLARKNTDNAIYKKIIKIQMYKKTRIQPVEQKGQLSRGRKPTRSGCIHFGYHQDQRRHRHHRLHKATLSNKIIVSVITVTTVTTDFQMYNFVT